MIGHFLGGDLFAFFERVPLWRQETREVLGLSRGCGRQRRSDLGGPEDDVA